MNKLRSVLRDVAGPERVHAADIVFELCENQWLSTLPELKQNSKMPGGQWCVSLVTCPIFR